MSSTACARATVAVLLLALVACSGPPVAEGGSGASTPPPVPADASPDAGAAADAEIDADPIANDVESPAPTAPETLPAPDVQAATVERIVDGDTIWVRVDEPGGPLPENATHKIRLLEIDTPETVHPGMSVQCYGPEATAFAEATIPPGTHVGLEADVEDLDRFGRYLRYVYLPDGRMFNELAVRGGYATAALYEPNDRHIERMYAAEAEARAARRGLWGACDEAASAATASTERPASPPPDDASTPSPTPASNGACDANYTPCVPAYPPDVNCSAVGQPVTVTGQDVHNLDGDGDGTGCQS